MNDSRKKTKFLVLLTMFCSIQVVLMLTPFLGYVPLGPIRATTMHIPVILAGVLLGVRGGAVTGFVFGLSSVIINTVTPTITSFVFTPFYSLGDYQGNFMSLVIAIVPRILLGVFAAMIYRGFKNKKWKLLGSGLTALVCTVIHSILVLGMIYIFFGPSYAAAKGVEFSGLFTLLLGVITTNSLLEAILATFIVAPLVTVLEPITKKVI
ncbi:MAG: ECF transporter S component [Turicibacter sp.]|nr:ECF transporter S component [Turicibacter sp.]